MSSVTTIAYVIKAVIDKVLYEHSHATHPLLLSRNNVKLLGMLSMMFDTENYPVRYKDEIYFFEKCIGILQVCLSDFKQFKNGQFVEIIDHQIRDFYSLKVQYELMHEKIEFEELGSDSEDEIMRSNHNPCDESKQIDEEVKKKMKQDEPGLRTFFQ